MFYENQDFTRKKFNESVAFAKRFFLIALILACFALSPQARAVCREGCLTNQNTVLGDDALLNNTTGTDNTATGFSALFDNTTGSFNTANGSEALSVNTTGFGNTATGFDALLNNTTGENNIALGFNAGRNVTTGSNNIYIGNPGSSSGESNKIRIGRSGTQKAAFIAGITGVTVPAGVGVIVGSDGKLGTVVSSAGFKDGIKPMNKASEAILALQPVTFRYKPELDPEGIPQFGLLAEDVGKVDPALVARDADGKAYTVRYEAVNAILLNEFLKEHRTVQELKKEIAALTATVQKVSAQVEMSRPAPLARRAGSGRDDDGR